MYFCQEMYIHIDILERKNDNHVHVTMIEKKPHTIISLKLHAFNEWGITYKVEHTHHFHQDVRSQLFDGSSFPGLHSYQQLQSLRLKTPN